MLSIVQGDPRRLSLDFIGPRSRFGLVCDLLCCRGNYVTSITRRNLVGKASKLPTYYLVHRAPPRPAVTHTPQRDAKVTVPKYTKVALHAAAVDHLLMTKSLRVPKKPLARH